ncbi:Bifunctional protein putA [Sphingomonas paucimobilis]|nr:Bifunctional protein putA [Sphingomonas paucimobilis]
MTSAVTSDARKTMKSLYRAPRTRCPEAAARPCRRDPGSARTDHGHASGLLADLRAAQNRGWVNQFLQEYRLNSSEGVALLSLAEAFLRVPDPETADLLIADKLGEADWRAHTGRSASKLVNSATWGLVVGRALVGEGEAGPLKRLLSRAGEPFVRQAVGAAMRMMGEIFVMGRTIEEAMRRMKKPENKGFTASFDMLGEAARTHDDAERYFQAYVKAIDAVGSDPAAGHSVSVKLSALHPRYELPRAYECVPALTDMLAQLARQAADKGIALTVDAEESERLEMSLDIIGGVAALPALKGWDGFGMAVQAYGKRARAVIAWANGLDRIMNVRLVKGAYWDSEIKRTQVEGLNDYPLFTRKAATDVSYLAVAKDMLAAENIRPAFASHNALTVATILEWAGNSHDFEFQRLHGMGDGLYERLVREHGHKCRIYAPVGGHRDLLAYLVRRLLENGANSSFVHQLADARLTEAEILADPVAKIAAVGGARHPSIPLPIDLFAPGHRNSTGIDLSDIATLDATVKAVNAPAVKPVVATADVASLVARAHAAFPAWNATPLDTRAAVLEKLADLLEQDRERLMAILVQEAFKTIPDAIGEVREAADFCRYYAQQARARLGSVELPGPTGERNTLHLEGRGVWGHGRAVELPVGDLPGADGRSTRHRQHRRRQARAADARHRASRSRAGLSRGCAARRAAARGRRPEVGQALTEDHRIAGVAFTGSTATAKRIARTLVADDDRPIVPLIAETGGINAMIVDSTALPEQVVADVITSSFRSAGQRCSALRLLLVQADVADNVIEMLKGAMETLVLGPTGQPATDVGPVIDQAAYDKLMAYRASMVTQTIKTLDAPVDGLFVPPTLIRLDRVEDLTQEWFGPILHVATWEAGTLSETIAKVNAKGYGLTMGLHSRIARASEVAESEAAVGNLYINRSMIGAIVGSQPFGGEGLSGTGPKAGGPHYLYRFCAERAVSVDTTSAGGNATLLSLDEGASDPPYSSPVRGGGPCEAWWRGVPAGRDTPPSVLRTATSP